MEQIKKETEQFVMRRPVWISLVILTGVFVFTRIWTVHQSGLATKKNMKLLEQSALHGYMAYSLFLIVLYTAIVFLPTPILWRAINPDDSSKSLGQRAKGIGEALLAAGIVIIACLPMFFRGATFYTIADLAAAPSNHLEGWFAILLLGLAIPVVSEVIYRGILFRQSMGSTGISAACIASSALYAHVWPFPGYIPSLLLGVASSIVYYRSRCIVAAFFTNIAFTISSTLLIEWLRIR
jgi:membrane protease YdiL (CAAX protease family)